MTGFATRRSENDSYSWIWDIRSVNSKGLDIRLRVPDWIEGLEPKLRAAFGKRLGRGNVSLSLRVSSDETDDALGVDAVRLDQALQAIDTVNDAAIGSLATVSAADILRLPGVLISGGGTRDTSVLCADLLADFPALLDDLIEMRRSEGTALTQVLTGQLDHVETLVEQAIELAPERLEKSKSVMSEALARINGSDGADPARVAQELALIAVKADVTEELDRLTTHITAAREMLSAKGSDY